MKESVAIAKEADRKKASSPTKSGNSIHRVRNEPERQLGYLRSVIENIRRDGGTPSVESLSTELSSVHTAQRAPVLLALQQTHGNRYVQRVVAGIQAKLKVGQPNDRYEQEADRVADQVMHMPEPRVRQPEEEEKEEELLQTKPLAEQISPLVQRQVEEGEEEEEILQTKENPGLTSVVIHDLESRIPSLKGSGQPLPEVNRGFMERRFGIDFSGVRLHTDSDAAQMSRELNAEAFTYGRDIYFGAGLYSHGTSSGKRLLAHELTHVIQQNNNDNISIQQKIGDDHDLQSPRFSGNTYLEMAYDDEVLIRKGWRGTAVRLIQESLLDLGYNLPQYGADGVFGDETHATIIEFQINNNAEKIDGITGPETMDLLDLRDTKIHNRPPGTRPPGPADREHEILDGDSPQGPTFPAQSQSINEIRWQFGLPIEQDEIPLEEEDSFSHATSLDTESSNEGVIMAELRPPPAPTAIRPPWIQQIDINLTGKNMRITWSNGITRGPYDICSGKGCPNTSGNPCRNPNIIDSYCTPTGTFRNLMLGGENYINAHGDSMCWYVAFHITRGIGIHNCQTVSAQPSSHGCVRVVPSVARLVHNNVTNRTAIVVGGNAPTRPWSLPCNLVGRYYSGCPCP